MNALGDYSLSMDELHSGDKKVMRCDQERKHKNNNEEWIHIKQLKMYDPSCAVNT